MIARLELGQVLESAPPQGLNPHFPPSDLRRLLRRLLRRGFLLRQGFLLRRLLRLGYEGQEGFGGQDGGQDDRQAGPTHAESKFLAAMNKLHLSIVSSLFCLLAAIPLIRVLSD
jgi:hypothetical protein